jgi:chorismate mutase
MTRQTLVQLAKQAAAHEATLSTFAGVVTLLEGGGIYDPRANKAAHQIIRACKAEQQRQLTRYDAALAKLAKRNPS